MTEKEYRELPYSKYLSASFLKMFYSEGPESLLKEVKYDNDSLLKGSIVDDLAFNNNNFENIYYVSTLDNKPTKSEQILLKSLYAVLDYDDIFKNSIYIKEGLNLIKELKLWSNIVDSEKLIKKLNNKTFKKYLEEIYLSKNKTIISGNDYMEALNIVNNLKNSEFTKDYFITKDISKKQVLFQVPILYKYLSNDFKSLLDIVCIDNENKTIRAVDLKTGFDKNNNFKYAILKYRYDIQAALYTLALETYIIKNGLKDYKILNPIYIYTQVSKPDRPLCFEFNSYLIKSAFQGFTLKNGYEYKGIVDLVEEINWHRENNIYNYTKKQYENKGIVNLKNELNITSRHRSLPNNLFSNYAKNNNQFFINRGGYRRDTIIDDLRVHIDDNMNITNITYDNINREL